MRIRVEVGVEQGEAFAQVFVLPGRLGVGTVQRDQTDGAVADTRRTLGDPVGQEDGVAGGVEYARDGFARRHFVVDLFDELLFGVDVAVDHHLEVIGGAEGFQQMSRVGAATQLLVVVVHAGGHLLEASPFVLLVEVVLSTVV